MKEALRRFGITALLMGALGTTGLAQSAELPVEMPLWKDLSDNPIFYADGERVRTGKVEPWAPTGRNRIHSRVTVPSYTIHRTRVGQEGGAGLVICPGGGYYELRLDWEGHDIALWLAEHGVTSLVLKHRTNQQKRGGNGFMDRQHDWETYLPEVVSDAKEAIRILRSRSGELGLDPGKIGVAGFSAGGHLSFSAAFDARYWKGEYQQKGHPDFVGLFYPWIWDDFDDVLRDASRTCPTFIFNGGEDPGTPAIKCIELFPVFRERKIPVELHIYAKGGHGFALGDGAGRSAAQWKRSFVAWLQDQGFLDRDRE